MTVTPDDPETGSLSSLGEALEAAAGSFGAARANATESAKVAAAKVQSTASSGAYHAAYGVSYGLVFSAVFLKEFLPESSAVRRGLEDGAEAAFDAVAARRAEAEAAKPVPVARRKAAAKPAGRATKRVVRVPKST